MYIYNWWVASSMSSTIVSALSLYIVFLLKSKFSGLNKSITYSNQYPSLVGWWWSQSKQGPIPLSSSYTFLLYSSATISVATLLSIIVSLVIK